MSECCPFWIENESILLARGIHAINTRFIILKFNIKWVNRNSDLKTQPDSSENLSCKNEKSLKGESLTSQCPWRFPNQKQLCGKCSFRFNQRGAQRSLQLWYKELGYIWSWQQIYQHHACGAGFADRKGARERQPWGLDWVPEGCVGSNVQSFTTKALRGPSV